MACKLEEAVQEINKLLALPTVNKEKMMVDKLNLAKQSIEAPMKLLGAQPKPEEKINISSGTKGLPGALTNHTVLSKKKGSIESDYPIEFNGTKYDSVESAYQGNKVDESKTKPAKVDSQNYKLMVGLIGAKFANHPRLVSAVTKLGGLKYLENAVHQPTNKNTVWETGGQDWFMSAMKEAYNNAIAEPVKVVDQIEVKEEAKPNKSESTEVLFDSKELKTEDKVYQLLSIYKDKDAPKIGGGMIDNTIMEKYEIDEDKPNAEMVKGSQDSTLKDMLPYVDGRTITAWGKAADKWYKEQNRKPAVRKHVEDILKIIAQIENEPKLIDELNWGNTKQEVGKMTTNEINEMALKCAK